MVNVISPGIAAITWEHTDERHIRVYFQKDDGFIYEASWDDSDTSWHSKYTTSKLIQAKPNTPLSAILFMPWQPEIRIYYLDTSNMLQEYVYSTLKGGWQTGGTLPSPHLNPMTTLAALTWARPTNQQIRVFYQKTDDTIQELVYSSESNWSVGFSFTDKAYPGTSLNAITIKKEYIRTFNPIYHVFWQAYNLGLNEYIWSGRSWSNRGIKFSPPPPALSGIGAVGWIDQSDRPHINVFMEKDVGNGYPLRLMLGYDHKAGWILLGDMSGDPSMMSQVPIAVVGWVDEVTQVEEYRIYSRRMDNHGKLTIAEVRRQQPKTEFAFVSKFSAKFVYFEAL